MARLTPELFTSPDLMALLSSATPEEVNEAAFGVVTMNTSGMVEGYNVAECGLSGLSADRVRGRNFFIDVAPCTNNFMVAERFGTSEALDEFVDYVFTFRMNPTRVRLRLLKSPGMAHQYLVVERA